MLFLAEGAHAQKPVSKTTDNLHKKKAKPPARVTRRIKKNELKVAGENSGPSLTAKVQAEKFKLKSEVASGFKPEEVRGPKEQAKVGKKLNDKISVDQTGKVDRAKGKKFEKAQNKIVTRDKQGNALTKVDKLYQIRGKSMQNAESEVGFAIHPQSRKKLEKAANKVITRDQKGNTVAHVDKQYNLRSKNFQVSNAEQQFSTAPATQKKQSRSKNQQVTKYTDGITMGKAKQKELMEEKSAKARSFTGGNTLTREAHRAMMEKKSKEASDLQVGRTVNRKDYKKFLKDQSKSFSESEKGNTITRSAHKEMMQKKSSAAADFTQGKTMGREAYKTMVKTKSSKYADFEPKIVITREEKLNIMKNKSRAIDKYEAGYLNTAAERRARIRSFFFPGQYQANTPQEKLDKMRSMSGKIARYDGKIKHRTYQTTMHPSARHLGRFTLASMDDRLAFREKITRRVNNESRGNLPSYLKNKPQKPRYDRKTEKGLWND